MEKGIVNYTPKEPANNGVQYLKVQQVLNVPLVIESASIETVDGLRGPYESMVLNTDRGAIRTGAKVLVEQMKSNLHLFEKGQKLRVKIVAKTGKKPPYMTYFSFERPD
ncbi:MAG: hypothetical protein QXL94_03505 [Candidatus Parvarchaeum sp.]